MKHYKKLLSYQKEITELECIINILNWDLRISSPLDSKNYIINIKTELDSKLFKLKTDKEYENILLQCINSEYFKILKESEQRYIKNLLNHYYENTKIPKEFYSEYMKLCSLSTTVWEEAKKENNYEKFKPYLTKVIEMTKQYYTYLNPNQDLYDVMLNQYEIGMTSKEIDILFDELKANLIPLIKKVSTQTNLEYKKDYTTDQLLDCAKFLLEYIGFDMNKGVIGIYEHGFTEKMSANDIRIAFKKTNDPIDFVTTVTHEGGHGIFEQNINDSLSKYENSCISNLFALHESQSRFYENILSRNKNFWIPIYDEIKTKLNLNIELEEFIKLLNTVKLGPIRINADELTYCLHIIVRYEIERELFKGNITVDDLPQIWKEKMKEYLNIDITNDKDGLMQDIHWSEGGFGYFPSYLLGTIYDGIFLEYIEENLGSIDELLKKGNIKTITNFLINNIYTNGGAYNSKEIIENVCKKELTVKPIIKYFNKKFNK